MCIGGQDRQQQINQAMSSGQMGQTGNQQMAQSVAHAVMGSVTDNLNEGTGIDMGAYRQYQAEQEQNGMKAVSPQQWALMNRHERG